jgi:hypothetical protein
MRLTALPHGSFLPWIEAEFDMAHKTAMRFIQVADRFGSKLDTMSTLNLTALYELDAAGSAGRGRAPRPD